LTLDNGIFCGSNMAVEIPQTMRSDNTRRGGAVFVSDTHREVSRYENRAALASQLCG
jgi:hypothetical protein